MYCNDCGCKYTPNPKTKAYSEEKRKEALKLLTLGNTGRGIGKTLSMSKSNAYRWAREAEKKSRIAVDKSENGDGSI